MGTRQGICYRLKWAVLGGFLGLIILMGCDPVPQSVQISASATNTASIPTGLPTAKVVATLIPTLEPSRTPRPSCGEDKGEVRRETMHSTVLPGNIVYSIYLPPCYTDQQKYPVLYWLHGLTYNDDQWIRLGGIDAADRLIMSGEIEPLIIVMPYNSNSEGPLRNKFGEALAESMVPWIDENYSTIAAPEGRWIGGLSRGGGWAYYIYAKYTRLFGAVGGHSPAIFFEYDPDHFVETIKAVWQGERLWFDVGDQDKEVKFLSASSEGFTAAGILHTFTVNSGNHDEAYWSAHVEEYLRWYAGENNP
jgi:enterochelin esterase-like enzyme